MSEREAKSEILVVRKNHKSPGSAAFRSSLSNGTLLAERFLQRSDRTPARVLTLASAMIGAPPCLEITPDDVRAVKYWLTRYLDAAQDRNTAKVAQHDVGAEGTSVRGRSLLRLMEVRAAISELNQVRGPAGDPPIRYAATPEL